jgi:hypothetical protein
LTPEFDDRLWKRHKALFMAAQHDKCGYCEMISSNHYGSVDHYAPKSRVEELAEDGTEEALGNSVAGRRTPSVCDLGYWWLAYSWENWLFACERCNTAWKGCLFPVQQSPRRIPPRRGDRETWLLLNPFGEDDPIEHLHFDRLGQISARDLSERGGATIRTCGLDRESLRRVRELTASYAYGLIARLFEVLSENEFRRAVETVDDLLRLGDERAPHAGMVRSIVFDELSHSWSTLQKFRDRLNRRASRVKNQRAAGHVGSPPARPRRYGPGRR